MMTKKESSLKHKWESGDITFEFQTSGSTGLPKKITAKRSHLEKSARRTLSYLDIKSGTILNCLSTDHIGGAMQVIRSLVGNLKLQELEPCKNPFLNKEIDWKNISLLSLVPYQLESLIDIYTEEFKLCQNILLGGAPLSTSLRNKIKEYELINCFETYGMTETLSHVALKNTISHTQFHCLDGVTISQDERECLILNDTFLDLESVKTNDIIRAQSSKSFSWIGRYDNVINSGGIKHVTELLEQKLAQKLNKNRFIIYSQKDNKLGETINLIVESDYHDNELTKKEFYSTVLGKYEVPKTVCFVNKLSETKTQKILRDASITNSNKASKLRIS